MPEIEMPAIITERERTEARRVLTDAEKDFKRRGPDLVLMKEVIERLQGIGWNIYALKKNVEFLLNENAGKYDEQMRVLDEGIRTIDQTLEDVEVRIETDPRLAELFAEKIDATKKALAALRILRGIL